MRFSRKTIQAAFDEIARLEIDNKFWGVLTIVKNLKKHLHLPTSIGVMDLIVSDLDGIKKDLKNFFSLQSVNVENDFSTNEVWILLRNDFVSWVSRELLVDKRVSYLALAVFLFRNQSFSEQPSKENLIQRVKSLFGIPKEWEKIWFKEISSLDIQFENSISQVWENEFSVNGRTYKFDRSHGSIVFKSSKGLYSVVAKPDELSRGPFYQPLYAALENALLFIKKDFFVDIQKQNQVNAENADFPSHPAQYIYYGVPGCGKSKQIHDGIAKKLDGIPDAEFHVVRCVFHPEYGNADFVGQIYPHVLPDGGVDYRFKPGPFAEILRRAYNNPSEPFFLVIEEINRGNAAAIFGEMFQLLDRILPGNSEGLSGNVYGEGWSAYGVDNDDVNAYIRLDKSNGADSKSYKDSVAYDNVSFSVNTAIRLPPNLSLLATMNTSDQNVFTLDNAFLRRFRLKMIRNDLKDSKQFDLEIGDSGVRWGSFRKWVNGKILSQEFGISRAEDKCLGGWFIVGEPGEKFPKDEFAEKVLKYLWDDCFRRSVGDAVFKKGEIHSLSQLIDAFESAPGFEAFERIFALTDEEKSALQTTFAESFGKPAAETAEPGDA